MKNNDFTSAEFVCGCEVGPRALVATFMASIQPSRETISIKMSNEEWELSNENVVEGRRIVPGPRRKEGECTVIAHSGVAEFIATFVKGSHFPVIALVELAMKNVQPPYLKRNHVKNHKHCRI